MDKRLAIYLFVPVIVAAAYFIFIIVSGAGTLISIDLKTFVYYILLTPILEEAVFRGGLQAFLQTRTRSLLLANTLASAIFAASHIFFSNPVHGVAVFAPSLVFGYVYGKSGRIILPILIHAFFNMNVFISYQSGILGKIF